ncbi:MAG: arginine decarboxylase, pyruvoyl-dependent [Deltaproteobacteria bacterium]|nr:arginine decarboxylase, pyruvoyl-dependent [Deltaproteobacteria bacterium]
MGNSLFVPTRMFLTRGVGVHREKLTSFEMALRDAGIAAINIIRVSSIFPPGCKIIRRSVGVKELPPGAVVPCVVAETATNEPNRLIVASVGVAQPRDSSQYGYLSEHHAYGQDSRTASEYAEDLAATMLATTLGVDFDPDTSYDEKREIWRISGQIVSTTALTQTAKGNKDGLWTTVIAASVLLP